MESEQWDAATEAYRLHQAERAMHQLLQGLIYVEERFPDVFLHYTISVACDVDGVYFMIEQDGNEEKRRHYGLADLEELNKGLAQASEAEPPESRYETDHHWEERAAIERDFPEIG
jgi:hypothetical protein